MVERSACRGRFFLPIDSVFFFSSRRRHTRFSRDWSSDVCSSDLPDLLNAPYAWTESDHETAIQAAAQVGSVPVAEYLLENGAPLEICTAAMLGRKEEVERRIRENLGNINSSGAHGIPLLPHAAWSGDIELVQYLFQNGAKTGSSLALQNAITRGYYGLVVWLIENASPDLNAKNFQGKTSLSVAIERKQEIIAQLLKNRGGKE